MPKYVPSAKDISNAVTPVLMGRRVAVVFSGDLKNRVRATFQGKRDARNTRNTVVVTVGVPNWAERKFLKLCRKCKAKPKRVWFPGAK